MECQKGLDHLGGGFIHMFYFHPDPWGFMIQFDLRIFFNWVGSTTNIRSFLNMYITVGG